FICFAERGTELVRKCWTDLAPGERYREVRALSDISHLDEDFPGDVGGARQRRFQLFVGVALEIRKRCLDFTPIDRFEALRFGPGAIDAQRRRQESQTGAGAGRNRE